MMTRVVTDYLDNSVQRFPDKMAFADEHREMSFSQLQQEAWHIASGLIVKCLFKKPVAVYLDKSVECIAAFMGVAYSGNFYTPVDTAMPQMRIKKILATLQPSLVITDRIHIDQARQFADSAEVLAYEDLLTVQINEVDIKNTRKKIIDMDVLYVLFTSGSTGNPKGVIVSHAATISYMEWASEMFAISEHDIIGNQTPFFFSMSVLDIYQTLKNACSMYIIPRQLFSFPIKLLEYIIKYGINMIYWVPSALCIVANLKALGKRDLSCLKKILFAGEVMPAKQLNMWRNAVPDALFANLFGPTEVTDICNCYIVKREIANDEPVPIGEACPNMDMIILNDKDEVCHSKEEIGELCIRGISLSYGYYNDLPKTQIAFVQNPLNTAYCEVIYRTGDLVRYNEYGELIYVCRKDFQIKHMGHRIELGEIETAVSSFDAIASNCCLYDEKKSKIVLFYVGNLPENKVICTLKTLVPEYMVPNKVIRLVNMPLNLNGKIDRITLKKKL